MADWNLYRRDQKRDCGPMTHLPDQSYELLNPIDIDWTFAELLEWIGADDRRCHDERLRGLLDAIDPGAPVGSGAVVVLVRSLAARVVADPALGELRIRDVGVVSEEVVGEAGRVLVHA